MQREHARRHGDGVLEPTPPQPTVVLRDVVESYGNVRELLGRLVDLEANLGAKRLYICARLLRRVKGRPRMHAGESSSR